MQHSIIQKSMPVSGHMSLENSVGLKCSISCNTFFLLHIEVDSGLAPQLLLGQRCNNFAHPFQFWKLPNATLFFTGADYIHYIHYIHLSTVTV